jgi:two-component system sensor histidine kinase ResE
MNLPIIISAVLTLTFGVIAIYFSIRLDQVTKHIDKERDALKGKEDVTHMVVHELRAPLTAIKDSAKLLATAQTTMSEDDKQKLLTLMHDQSDRLLMQISTILDAAKIENGRLTIHKAPGDLNQVVSESMAIFKPQAAMKQISLTFQPDPNTPSIQFDRGYMTEVVNNLVSNSLKYTKSGDAITLSTISDTSGIKLQVQDTGAGIPKEKQAVLFTKFGQAHAGDGAIGTGLGLYIVKGIVEAHNGTIHLDSEEHKGTTITVTLPRA